MIARRSAFQRSLRNSPIQRPRKRPAIPPTPSLLDKWLEQARGVPQSKFLMFEEVLCEVERETIPPVDDDPYFIDPPRHVLYIRAKPAMQTTSTYSSSPRAILATYEGEMHNLDAPQWTRWPETSLVFRQSRDNFIKLFHTLADLNENTATPNLSIAMRLWISAASAGFSMEGRPTVAFTRAHTEELFEDVEAVLRGLQLC